MRLLAAFILVLALDEWLELFEASSRLGCGPPPAWLFGIRLNLLAFFFPSLAAFGGYLLAMACQGSIGLRQRTQEAILTITDQDVGFDPRRNCLPPGGWGLASLQEHIEMIGGQLEIQFATG